jgi:hypothetical protein
VNCGSVEPAGCEPAKGMAMRKLFIKSILAVFVLVALPFLVIGQTAGQSADEPSSKPTKKASAEISGPAPVHDLTGVWMMHDPPGMHRPFTNYTFTKDEPELTEWGKEKYKQAKPSNGGEYTLQTTNDPVLTKCWPPGVPRVYFHPYPFEFVTTPKAILMLYEYDHWVRRFYTDGRPIPTDPDLSWMGTSVAHWADDTTLVVDTVGFNDKTWLDRLGHAHSDKLHVVERFHRADKGHLELGITMIDPIALAKPWTTTFYYELKPDWEIQEISCSGDYLQFSNFEK